MRLRPQHAGDDDAENDRREAQQHVDQPAKKLVGQAAEEAGDHAGDAADQRRDEQRSGADRKRHPRAVDDARKDVTADIVGAEPVRRRRRLQARIGVDGERRLAGEEPRKQADDHEQRDQRQAEIEARLASRPIFFELDAIALALEIAGETGASLHVVHVTCPEGIDLVSEAKARGVDVTVETCPHYLLLDRQDAARIGPAAKCAPPLRSGDTVRRMWDKLLSGEIDTIGSDHSPSPPDLKQGDDIFAMWGGIAGIQHGLPLMLSRNVSFIPQISSNVAERFRIERKGALLPGNDADFFLLEPTDRGIATSDLITRHAISPYIGMKPRFAITSTWLRGRRVTAETRGRFLTPTRS